jgi:hypothetical protein
MTASVPVILDGCSETFKSNSFREWTFPRLLPLKMQPSRVFLAYLRMLGYGILYSCRLDLWTPIRSFVQTLVPNRRFKNILSLIWQWRNKTLMWYLGIWSNTGRIASQKLSCPSPY